jgi:zinc protease
VTLADKRVEQPVLQRHWRAPSYLKADGNEAEALDLLAQILGGGATSRLYRALVADQKIAASAGAWYGGTAVDETRFGFWATPLPGQSFEALEAAADRIVADIAENGVTDAELERAKTRLVADAIYAQDNQSTLARYYGATLSTGGSVVKLQTWPQRVAAVDAESLRRAARKHLVESHSVTGLLEGLAESAVLSN